jgi:hypothetical protein
MSDFISLQDTLLKEILNQPLAEIKAPTPYPPGKYLCLIDGPPIATEKGGKNYIGTVDFQLKLLQAGEDVDRDQLEKALDGKNLSDQKPMRHRFFISEDPNSAWRLKRFLLKDLGIEGSTPNQTMPQAAGKQVWVKLAHQATKDGTTTVYANIVATEKVA